MTFVELYQAYPGMVAFATTAFVFLIFALWHHVYRLRQRVEMLEAAKAVTAEFYALAERIFDSKQTPRSIAEVIGYLTVAVTNSDEGKDFSAFLMRPSDGKTGHELDKVMDELRDRSPELHAMVIDAVHAGIFAVMAAHADSAGTMAIGATRNAAVRPAGELSRIAAAMRNTLNGGGGNGSAAAHC